MATDHWDDADSPPHAWDRCMLGGELLPGVTVVGVKIGSDLDVKKPDGGTGATIRDKGDPPTEITINLNVLTRDELDEFERLWSTSLRPRSKSGARDPLEIIHPNPNFWGITAVTIKDIDAPSPSAVRGWDITINCLEWFPAPKETPKNKNKSPKDAKDKAGWNIAYSHLQPGSRPSGNGSAVDNLGLDNLRKYPIRENDLR